MQSAYFTALCPAEAITKEKIIVTSYLKPYTCLQIIVVFLVSFCYLVSNFLLLDKNSWNHITFCEQIIMKYE